MRLMQSADAFNPVNLHWVLISHANIPLMQSVMRNRKLLAQTASHPPERRVRGQAAVSARVPSP